jgi:phospholipid/cholesterol/gamma-HCH transport system substrate-binding protein
MINSLSRWQSSILGAVTLTVLVLAGAGLFAIGSRHWPGSHPFHVRAGFQDIRGVEVGTRVRIQGVDAGEVVAVALPQSPGERVTLRLRLNENLRHLVRADATVQIVSEGMIGAKVVDVRPGKPDADPVEEEAMLATGSGVELPDLLAQANGTLNDLRDGKGVLGGEIIGTLQQVRDTMGAFQQVGEAGKKMPLVRDYVKDPLALLVRPDCECNRQVFAESELFEPGRAVLTAQGRQRLEDLAPRLSQLLRHDKAEMIVLGFADPKAGGDRLVLKSRTASQTEAVCDYLKSQKVQKAGWFSSRKVTGLGLGPDLVPGEELSPSLPVSRVEVRVYVPQLP